MTHAADTPIPPRFAPAIAALRALARHERYRGVLLFGSVAGGTATPQSDLDALVLTDGADPCANISHPPNCARSSTSNSATAVAARCSRAAASSSIKMAN